MRLAAQAKGGYYPTPERVVDLIAELIHTPSGYYHRGRETIRILDPCCGAGDALERLAEGLDQPNAMTIETYGVELHRDRAEQAEKRLHRTLAVDLFATSMAVGHGRLPLDKRIGVQHLEFENMCAFKPPSGGLKRPPCGPDTFPLAPSPPFASPHTPAAPLRVAYPALRPWLRP